MTMIRSRKVLDSARGRIEALSIPEPNSGCWLWIGSVKPNGYGNFFLDGGFTQAHRAAYIAFVGPIPDGMVVCHQCDNKACVNPSHLRVGSHKDNSREATQRGLRARFYTRTTRAKSGVVGVCKDAATGRWKATIRRQHLGYFDTLEAAAAARQQAEKLS